MKEEDRLLNVNEASEILGLKPRTLYQWSWLKKHLPFVKIGKLLRVSERDLTDFIKKNKIRLKN